MTLYEIETLQRDCSNNLSTAMLDNIGLAYYEFDDGTFLYLSPDKVKKLCEREKEYNYIRGIGINENELHLPNSLPDELTSDSFLKNLRPILFPLSKLRGCFIYLDSIKE
ncbi:MAG TPA: hypothetical protein PKD18_16135 [Saprospiraceae bacterium]|nr:hypothetical protein [Saprospiraceae bacterium]